MNQNYLRQLLTDWGDWVDRAALHTGYPTESSIVSAKEPIHAHVSLQWQLPGGGSYRYALPSRHAILCFEMPSRLVRVHQAILRLEDEERAVLALWYAYSLRLVRDKDNPKLEGKPMHWHREDKAGFVGMSYGTLAQKVSRARSKLAKILDRGIAITSEKVLEIAIVE